MSFAAPHSNPACEGRFSEVEANPAKGHTMSRSLFTNGRNGRSRDIQNPNYLYFYSYTNLLPLSFQGYSFNPNITYTKKDQRQRGSPHQPSSNLYMTGSDCQSVSEKPSWLPGCYSRRPPPSSLRIETKKYSCRDRADKPLTGV